MVEYELEVTVNAVKDAIGGCRDGLGVGDGDGAPMELDESDAK